MFALIVNTYLEFFSLYASVFCYFRICIILFGDFILLSMLIFLYSSILGLHEVHQTSISTPISTELKNFQLQDLLP